MATMLWHVKIACPSTSPSQRTGHVRTRTTKPTNTATAKVPRVLCGAFMVLDPVVHDCQYSASSGSSSRALEVAGVEASGDSGAVEGERRFQHI
jgi:hypothetical protein